jgi:hypothetical protein
MKGIVTPYCTQHVGAVPAGQHAVEHDEVGGSLRAKRSPAIPSPATVTS